MRPWQTPPTQATHRGVGRAGLLGKGRGVPIRWTGSVCLVLGQGSEKEASVSGSEVWGG